MSLPPAAPIAVTEMLETPAGTVNEETPGDVKLFVVVTARATPAPGPAQANTAAHATSEAHAKDGDAVRRAGAQLRAERVISTSSVDLDETSSCAARDVPGLPNRSKHAPR